MSKEKRYLIDVGMHSLPFPMRVISRADKDGQPTVAQIHINARIMREFEAGWIDQFIRIAHDHRDKIGTKTLRHNIVRYLDELKASLVKIDFEYPFFVQKTTPVSKEKCFVCYNCVYSAKVSSVDSEAKIRQRIEVPVITTYPVAHPETAGGLFGQLSRVVVDVETKGDFFPEDLVDIVDRHALAPVYSYLSEADQHAIIEKIHGERKTSVVTVDEVKNELAANPEVMWYSVRSQNYGMLHNYSTVIGTEKSMWIPSSIDSDDV
jgi:GTP cyclohydrolase I